MTELNDNPGNSGDGSAAAAGAGAGAGVGADNNVAKRSSKRYSYNELNVMIVSSQYAQGPQSATPVTIKPSRFTDAIFRLLGFKSKKSNLDKADCTTREVGTLIMLGVLIILFMISITGFFIMWFTEVYNNQYIYKLILKNDSVATEWWMKPPLSTHLRVHIFNYTNLDRYLKGLDKKIKLEDLGPYTYAENNTKVNVVFNDNYTITYKEHRSYKFIPELSAGKQYDQVVVPNVPLISAAASMKGKNTFVKTAMNIALAAMNAPTFKTLAADSLLWGYEDDLIDFSKRFSTKPLPFDKFGMLVNRNGTGRDTFQINTGEDDLRKLAVINEFNGKRSLNLWSTEQCNRIDGTDGSQFPPHLMNKKKKLEVFIQALCRKLPLVFDSEVNVFEGVPAWRYKAPLNVFSHPNINPDNQCFCHIESGVCPPSGVFNGSLCYEAPIFVSFPHFFSGDPILYDKFEGIKPDASKHQTFADVHPRLAFPIDGASRIQINIQFHKENFMQQKNVGNLPEGIILPVLWIEVTSGELTDDLKALIYHSTFSANAIQLALKYGTLLTCVMTFALIVGGCYYRGRATMDSGNENEKEYELVGINKKTVEIVTTIDAS